MQPCSGEWSISIPACLIMKPYLFILASMVIWSTWGPVIRWLGLPPAVVLFYTSFFAGIIVPVVLSIRGELDISGAGKSWRLFGALVLSSLANNLTYFYALGHTSVSNAVFTHYTAPVFVALLAPLLIEEPLQKETAISLPLALAGMIMIILAGGGFRASSADMPGIAAGAASGVAYAFIIIISRKLSRMLLHHKAVVILLWATAALTAPVAFTADYKLNARTLLLLLATGILHSTLAPLLYYNALRHVIAQHAAILGYMEPLAAIPLAMLLLAEVPSLLSLAGGLLILLSGYLVLRRAA